MGTSSSNKPDGDNIAITDNGNYIVDLHFTELIKDPPTMAMELKNTVGVVDHGLFCGMTTAGKLRERESSFISFLFDKFLTIILVIIAGSDGISVKEA